MAYDGNGNVEYVGWAEPGTATDSAGWRIIKVTYDGAGNVTSRTHADGTNRMTKAWDDRASYTY